jgi:hypothetical protein
VWCAGACVCGCLCVGTLCPTPPHPLSNFQSYCSYFWIHWTVLTRNSTFSTTRLSHTCSSNLESKLVANGFPTKTSFYQGKIEIALSSTLQTLRLRSRPFWTLNSRRAVLLDCGKPTLGPNLCFLNQQGRK